MANRLTTLSGRRNAELEHRTERELRDDREPAPDWHKKLAAARDWHKGQVAARDWHKELVVPRDWHRGQVAARAWHKELVVPRDWHKELVAARAWHRGQVAARAWHKELVVPRAWHKGQVAARAWHKELVVPQAWHRGQAVVLAWHKELVAARAWHKDLAPARTPAEHAPVTPRSVQGVKQDPTTRPSSPGRSRTKGLARARRTREGERLPRGAGPVRGLDRAVPAPGQVLREPGRIKKSVFCRAWNRQVTCQAVLIQALSRGFSRQRDQAHQVRTSCRCSTGLEVPEWELPAPSRAQPGRGPTWPGPATRIPSGQQRPAACRRRALPRIRECRV